MTASSQLTMLTRIGFATRGMLYIVIAFLVLRTGRAEDQGGALQYLAQGGGGLLLGIMAAGLIAYGIWRICDAAFDIERHGTDRKGLAERAGAGVSGVLHLMLALQAVRLMQGTSASSGGAEQGAELALSMPGGGAMVVVAAMILILIGLVQLLKAAKGSFLRHLEPQIAQQSWVQWSGRAGYAARGLVFLIAGYFLTQAGLQDRAAEAGGIADVLSWLTSPTDAIVAVGLLGFGVFSLVEARYRVLHDVPVDAAISRVSRRI